METVKILAIGNSFSEDATHYVHQIAAAAGINTKVVNLYIGGCSMERHWQNVENGGRYMYQINGTLTNRGVTIDEMLEAETWDHIITQQASHDSGWENSYEPFLGLLLAHIREKQPGAKLWLQETWAYEHGSTHTAFMRYHRDQQEMYDRLHGCYTAMAEKYDLGLIPSGTVIQQVRALPQFNTASGGMSLCRDGFHMSFDYGRFLLACTWVKTLFGVNVKGIAYTPESVNLTQEPDGQLLQLIREAVDTL